MIYRFTIIENELKRVIIAKKDKSGKITNMSLAMLYDDYLCRIPTGFGVYYVERHDVPSAHEAIIKEFGFANLMIESCEIAYKDLHQNGGYYTEDYFEMDHWEPFTFIDTIDDMVCL